MELPQREILEAPKQKKTSVETQEIALGLVLNNVMNLGNKLRYVEIPTKDIFNWLAPENITCRSYLKHLHGNWWNPSSVEQRKLFAQYWTEEFDLMTGHFTKLKKSMEVDGIRSPVCVVTGPIRNVRMDQAHTPSKFVRPDLIKNIHEMIYTKVFGGSRVSIAVELGIETIPCVVHDFSDLFPEADIITRKNYRNWFGKDYAFRPVTPHLACTTFTKDTRIAQRKAGECARRRMNV